MLVFTFKSLNGCTKAAWRSRPPWVFFFGSCILLKSIFLVWWLFFLLQAFPQGSSAVPEQRSTRGTQLYHSYHWRSAKELSSLVMSDSFLIRKVISLERKCPLAWTCLSFLNYKCRILTWRPLYMARMLKMRRVLLLWWHDIHNTFCRNASIVNAYRKTRRK